MLGGCDQTVGRADQKLDQPPVRSRLLTIRAEDARPADVVAKRRVIVWVEVGERSLHTIENALDAVGAWDEQELPVLGVGGELSDEDRAHSFGLESIKAAEIEDDSFGARLESMFQADREAVRVCAAEIAEELDPDHVPRVRDA